MALETVEEIVSAGVAAQASIDKHLALAYKAAKRLLPRKLSPTLGPDRVPLQLSPAISRPSIRLRPQRPSRPAPTLGP